MGARGSVICGSRLSIKVQTRCEGPGLGHAVEAMSKRPCIVAGRFSPSTGFAQQARKRVHPPTRSAAPWRPSDLLFQSPR
jgi:hypothetical protein